jgi:RND family efflux transporter MFP subunit
MNHASSKNSILCGLTLAAMFWSLLANAQMGGPATVRVAIASVKNIAPITTVPGTVISRNDARLAAEVPGRLTKVAEVGTRVRRGEPVAVIEDTSLRLENAELRAMVTRSEARLGFLDSEVRRFEQLAESNLAAATQLEQARSDRDVARGDLEVAIARLEQNQDKLDRTRILAPYGGVVVERLMMPGERVMEGSAVVRLVDQEHLEVIARAPLEYFSFISIGQELEVRTREDEQMGTVRTVVAIGDQSTHQFELRLDLNGSPFPVGQTVRLSIPVSDSREVLTVPRDALVLRSGGQSVFVVNEDNQAEQVTVVAGVGQGADIEITGGVSPGDRVVIRGNERLQPGQEVSVIDG